MKYPMFTRCLAAAGVMLLTGLGSTVHAAAITPQFDRFGHLDTTFGGSGVPNDSVAVTEIQNDSGTLSLGLAATPYRSIPDNPVGNDGAGTFFAQVGTDQQNTSAPRWNFSFHIGKSAGFDASGYSFELLYDVDPAANTDAAALGALDPTGYTDSPEANNDPDVLSSNSQRLDFGYLRDGNIVDRAPSFGPAFDPAADGEYSFALRALDGDGELAGQSAINVVVGDGPEASVPEPSALVLFGVALIGLFGGLRVQRRRTTR